jgi:putative nucleotidyltransferase with HDIG domain
VRERLTLPLFAVSGCLLGPALLIHFFGDPESDADALYTLHFVAVGVTTIVAGAAAAWLSLLGAQRGDARAVLVGMAFSTMAALLLLHGLATPDIIIGEQPGDTNPLLAFAGGATLPVGGAILALAAFPSLLRPDAVPKLLRLQIVMTAAIVVLGIIGLAAENLLPTEPQPGGPAAITALAIGLVLLGGVGLRAWRTYVLTRRKADLMVVCGICLLAVSLAASLTMDPWTLGWWASHVLELTGIGLVGVPVALDLYRGAQSRPLAGDLRGYELVREEEDYLGPHVRALMLELAEKDEYTEVHTRRVAHLAVQVGEQLELPAHRLRALAMGGLLHDIGKLQVPDAVLKKPAPLDEEEYALIKCHPEWGEALTRELGLPARVRRLVRSHHERLDGAGYPDGLGGEQLDLDVRILTTCDVYDALISKRVYRDAWSRTEALERLRAETGTVFDPRCVHALERVLKRPSGEYRVPAGFGLPSAPDG